MPQERISHIICANNMLADKFCIKNKPLNTFNHVLLNVYSYDDLTLHELDIIVSKIKEKCRRCRPSSC